MLFCEFQFQSSLCRLPKPHQSQGRLTAVGGKSRESGGGWYLCILETETRVAEEAKAILKVPSCGSDPRFFQADVGVQ